MLYDNPLIELHETLDGTAEDGTTLINDEALGKRFTFPVQNLDSGPRGSKKRLVGTPVSGILLRNTTGSALAAGALVKLDVADNTIWGVIKNAAALASTVNDYPVLPVSGYLGSKTVADDDIFWAIFAGPTKVLTASATLQTHTPGTQVVAAGTANGGYDAITTPTTAESFGWFGYALEDVDTGDTAQLKWVNMCARI